MSHNLKFLRVVDEPGEHRVVCSCGWSIRGDLETIKACAATHDKEGPSQKPKLLREGFVSGLPDDLIGNS